MNNKQFTILIITCVLLTITLLGLAMFYGIKTDYEYNKFCKENNGKYMNYDNCVKINDGEAIRYGITKIDNKYYLYKWGTK